MESPFGGSTVIATTLLSSLFFLLSASFSVVETPLSPLQQQRQELSSVKSDTKTSNLVETKTASEPAAAPKPEMVTAVVIEATDPAGGLTSAANSPSGPAPVPVHYMATAYSLSGRTASGKRVTKGFIAADPKYLPLGTRVRLDAGTYSGEYLVADTGGAVRGKRIDIWTPSSHEAMRFGRRTVKLTVLSYGPKRRASRRRHSR